MQATNPPSQGKNLVIVLLVSVIAWLGLQLWVKPRVDTPSTPHVATAFANKALCQGISYKPGGPHVTIDSPEVSGALCLRGAVLDTWVLRQYRQKATSDSPPVEMLSAKTPYWVRAGWASATSGDDSGSDTGDVPTLETVWQSDQTRLTPDHSVRLHWTNRKGVLFEIVYQLKSPYVLHITQRATNKGTQNVALKAIARVYRQDPIALHDNGAREGLLGMFSQNLVEKKYSDLTKGGQGSWQTFVTETVAANARTPASGTTTGSPSDMPVSQGWVGISDAYWLTALIPGQDWRGQGRLGAVSIGPNPDHADALSYGYYGDMQTEDVTLQPGQTRTSSFQMFAGPKKLSLLDRYDQELGARHLDLAVDFGWFYFLTKPFLQCLIWLETFLGNFGWAILVLTVLAKLALLPLAWRSHKAMARIRALQPKIDALKGRLSHDKMRLNQELLALYKREKASPVGGFLPMLIQLPVLFALYKVLSIAIEMRHAPFLGWIHDLSAPDPLSIFNGFGLLPWDVPSWMQVGLWPLIMGATTVLQQRTSGVTVDPQHKVMMTYVMPAMFIMLLARSSVGLVIYWSWNNLLSVLQQWAFHRWHRDAFASTSGSHDVTVQRERP